MFNKKDNVNKRLEERISDLEFSTKWLGKYDRQHGEYIKALEKKVKKLEEYLNVALVTHPEVTKYESSYVDPVLRSGTTQAGAG